MDALSISAASGMRSRMETLDLLANNIANGSTAGFKADREFYNIYTAPEAIEPGDYPPGSLPVVEKHWTDFTQGTMTSTGNPLDVALSGPGFFGVDGASGPVYTRNGNFRVGTNSEIETPDGHKLRKQGGGHFKVDSGKSLLITPDGTVQQDGIALGQIEIVNFDKPETLAKQGTSYFKISNLDQIVRTANRVQVQQGQLETSNVGPAENAVKLVNVMRQFEMLQRAVSIGGDMNKKAIEEVARVSG